MPGGKFEVAPPGWYPAHTIDHQNTLALIFLARWKTLWPIQPQPHGYADLHSL
jgi:hypothetical protein